MSRKRTPRHRRRKPASRRQQAPAPRRRGPPPGRNERALRERILKFTYQDRFNADFEPAIRLYFGEEALQGDILAVDEEAIPGFQEWYIHDYVTSESKRMIDLFAEEVGPRLPVAQRQMLDDWRRVNRYRLFEVQAVEPGLGLTVRDLLSGEVLEVNDISSSHTLLKWQIALCRPLLTEGRLQFAGTGLPLPPTSKPDLLDFASALWKKYQAQNPHSSLDDFYRDHSLTLYHKAMEIATAPPPPVYTPEGHPLLPCQARYTVADPQAVKERLDEADEFFCVGLAHEDETALAYVWLMVGRSRVPETSVKNGTIIRTEFTVAPGTPSRRTLGDVRLWINHMELSCLSRERLRAGKKLLKRTLGRTVRHLDDEYEEIEGVLASAEPSPSVAQQAPLINETTQRQMMINEYRRWLDESVPTLGGRTPRQAAREGAHDPAVREQLEELLKTVEYMEERRRRAGQPCIGIADIRRELGPSPD